MVLKINGKTAEEWEAELGGNFLVPVKACKWYNRSERLWEVWKEDAEGNQVGNCEYVVGKENAERVRKEMEEEIK